MSYSPLGSIVMIIMFVLGLASLISFIYNYFKMVKANAKNDVEDKNLRVGLILMSGTIGALTTFIITFGPSSGLIH